MAVFTVIENTTIASGGASSWTKSSIASSYDHLLVKASIRCERVHYDEQFFVRLNNNSSAASYSGTWFGGADSTPDSGYFTKNDYAGLGFPQAPAASAAAGTFGVMTIWIPDYANTTNFASVWIEATAENNSTTNDRWQGHLISGVFHSTAAVNQITIISRNGFDIAEHSTITLYGVSQS